jgi:hypothetical protein
VNPPAAKGGATRSFESLAAVAPGTNADTYGVSVNGTSSPENGFIIDGVSANDPAFGILAVPLSSEFVKEVNIITAGYLPEYGRSIGGVMDVVTKSGSNEFHGSIFASITPGAFEGQRAIIPREGTVISTQPQLGSVRDFGFEIGGPIAKDKLWFFAGFSVALQRTKLTRNLNRLLFQSDSNGVPILNIDSDGDGTPDTPTPMINAETGFQEVAALPGTERVYYADSQTMQYIGKLTWNINQDHNVTLSVFGAPTNTGGNGTFDFDNRDGTVNIGNINVDLRGRALTPAELLATVPRAEAARSEALATAAHIVDDVAARGEIALREQASNFDGVAEHDIRVPAAHLDEALETLDPAVYRGEQSRDREESRE